MMQQVNLYQEQFRATKARFSSHTLLLSCGTMAGAMVLIVCYGIWQVYSLGDETNTLDFSRNQAEQQLTRLHRGLAARHTNPVLGAQITELEALLAQRSQLRTLFERDGFTPGRHYSDYFIALARGHVTGLWLTDIRINGATQQLSIKGRTEGAENVPRYLEALSREPVLTGTRFTVFQIDPPQDTEHAGPALEFTVATTRMDEATP